MDGPTVGRLKVSMDSIARVGLYQPVTNSTHDIPPVIFRKFPLHLYTITKGACCHVHENAYLLPHCALIFSPYIVNMIDVRNRFALEIDNHMLGKINVEGWPL
jgi:hypothetical protein